MGIIEDVRSNSSIMYALYTCEQVTAERSPFYLKDLVECVGDFFPDELKSKSPIILDLKSIFVEKDYRNSNVGSSRIKELCEKHDDKYIILISGVLEREYGENFDALTLDKVLNKLDRFYIKNGFINVNDRIGMYEENVTYLYLNKTSRKLLEALGFISRDTEVKSFAKDEEE